MTDYMKSIMDVLVSCLLPRRKSRHCAAAHRAECSGGWAECDFNLACFYLHVINMHGRGDWRKGEMK